MPLMKPAMPHLALKKEGNSFGSVQAQSFRCSDAESNFEIGMSEDYGEGEQPGQYFTVEGIEKLKAEMMNECDKNELSLDMLNTPANLVLDNTVISENPGLSGDGADDKASGLDGVDRIGNSGQSYSESISSHPFAMRDDSLS